MPAGASDKTPDELTGLIAQLYPSSGSVPEAIESIRILYATFRSTGDREYLGTAIRMAEELPSTDGGHIQQVLRFLVKSDVVPARIVKHQGESSGYGLNYFYIPHVFLTHGKGNHRRIFCRSRR